MYINDKWESLSGNMSHNEPIAFTQASAIPDSAAFTQAFQAKTTFSQLRISRQSSPVLFMFYSISPSSLFPASKSDCQLHIFISILMRLRTLLHLHLYFHASKLFTPPVQFSFHRRRSWNSLFWVILQRQDSPAPDLHHSSV